MARLIGLTHLGLVALLAVTGVALAMEGRMYKGLEIPPYEVLETDGPVAIRRYAPHAVAEISVAGGRQGAAARGFRALAGYIFGGNSAGTKLAMTAPVTQAPGEGDGLWKVAFVMPAGPAAAGLPAPRHPAVRLAEAGGSVQAVIRFSGMWTERRLGRHAARLEAWMAARGLTPAAGPVYYFYDDPFTLPFNRRNEIAYTLGEAQAS